MSFNCLKTMPVILGIVASIGLASPIIAQIKFDPSIAKEKRAVFAVNIDVVELQKSELVSAFFKTMMSNDDSPFKPSDLKRVTAMIGPPKSLGPEMAGELDFYVYLTFNDPSVVAQVKAKMLEDGGKESKLGARTVVVPDSTDLPPGVFLDYKSSAIVIGTEAFLTASSNQLATKLLVDTYGTLPQHPIRVACDMDAMRTVLDQVYEMADKSADLTTKPFLPLIKEASTLTITSDIVNSTLLNVRLTSHDANEAKSMKLRLDAALGVGQQAAQFLPSSAGMEDILKTIDELKVELNGNTAIIDVKKPKGFEELVLGSVMSAQNAAKSMSDVNSFKQVIIALLNYHDTQRRFPFDNHVKNEDSKSGLSWKVAVLPYMEQGALYEQFDRDASFDSEKNAPLGKVQVREFQLNTGGQISWLRPTKVANKISAITDGTSNTIALIQNRAADAGPWTRPTSITPAEATAQFKALKDGETMIVGFYDGSAKVLSTADSLEDFQAMLEPNDGKAPEIDSNHGGFREQAAPKFEEAASESPFGNDRDNDNRFFD